MSWDADWVRARFPALGRGWTLLDNAGGTVLPLSVIERITRYLREHMVQLGASYQLSDEATELVHRGRVAAGALFGAPEAEVVLGGSTTSNVHVLSQALGALLAPGDEIVVTNLDHESNVGAWRRVAAARGAVVREWRLHAESAALRLAELEPLLGPRTRLVCFTHCSNVVGTVHDARAFVDRVHAAGALACVDGVALAPHRHVDFHELGADVYLVSLYKVFGPHVGLALVRSELLARVAPQNHYFLPSGTAYQLTPGNVNHELTASLPGVVEYLCDLDLHLHPGTSEGERSVDASLRRAFAAITDHETALAERLLAGLRDHPRVRVLGHGERATAARVPIVAFTVNGSASSSIPALCDAQHVAIRWGHFYAERAMRPLGLDPDQGVVRASLAHYNTTREVDALLAALEPVLASRAL